MNSLMAVRQQIPEPPSVGAESFQDLKRIRGERDWFRSLVQTAANSIIFLSPDYTILEFNPEAERLYGCQRKDIIGKNYLELFSPEKSRKAVIAEIKKVLSGKASRGFHKTIVTTEGKERALLWSVKRVLNIKGEPRGVVAVGQDITEQKKARATLLESEQRLKIYTKEIEEINTALRVLLKQQESDKIEMEENIISNVKHLILPYIDRLKKRNKAASEDLAYLNILDSNLKEIISPFSRKLISQYVGLTPKEIQIANLIKAGNQDKDIMEILNICPTTVKTHRQNIRKKLGIYNQKANLKTHLSAL